MPLFRCKMCGGTLEIHENETVAQCEYCGTKQTLPNLSDERRAERYDRANHFRRNNEFDKAMSIYEQILNEDSTDAEAYWSLVLCRYGIEYVEDPASHRRVPTVNRAQFTSIFADEDYKAALQYADGYQRALYEEEAQNIDRIQRGILEISRREKPFDIFICYKETDHMGRRTPDSVLANDLYHQLTREGFKVFFSRITLEDQIGTAYEPYIFAALNSAKVMVVLGTKPEYFTAAWVKNEWSRYLALIKQGANKMLIPAYRDMDPYDLPEEFSHLQAQDMSKLGFMQDLIRGIKKIIGGTETESNFRETAPERSVSPSVAPLLKRAFLFLEDGNWQEADAYCEKVLDQDPENAQAYLVKLMVELQVNKREELADCAQPFDDRKNYQKIVRFADAALLAEMQGYLAAIHEQAENSRKAGVYDHALRTMEERSEADLLRAAELFQSIGDFRDAEELARQCAQEAEAAHKNSIYKAAAAKMVGNDPASYEEAIQQLEKIPGWKDVDQLIASCQETIQELKTRQEEARLEAARRAEARRIAAERRRRTIARFSAIAIPAICVCVALGLLLNSVIIPFARYSYGQKLYQEENYQEAYETFAALDYKDSDERAAECLLLHRYNTQYTAAQALFDAGKFQEAAQEFSQLDYKDSQEKAALSRDWAQYGQAYQAALALYEAGDYGKAQAAFAALPLEESQAKAQECLDLQYAAATKLYEAGDYSKAYSAFAALDYRDSQEKAGEALKSSLNEMNNTKIGASVFFGAYEQDGDEENGKEELEWIVLEKTEDKVLLISKNILDIDHCCTSYVYSPHSSKKYTRNPLGVSITSPNMWDRNRLHSLLNRSFIGDSFGTLAQSHIVTTTIPADYNPLYEIEPGGETNDKIFLLSVQEAEKYFSSNTQRKSELTNYSKRKNLDEHDILGGKGSWWLRTPAPDQVEKEMNHTPLYVSCGAYIAADGSIVYEGGFVNKYCGVRPAMWVNVG